MTEKNLLSPDELCVRCDPTHFSFETTEDLPPLEGLIDQPRVLDGLMHGIRSTDKSSHVLVISSAPSSGALHDEIRRIANEHLSSEDVRDIVYVHNFEEPQKPRVLCFEPGNGRRFTRALEAFGNDLVAQLVAKFSSDEMKAELQKIREHLKTELIDPFNEELKKVVYWRTYYFQVRFDTQQEVGQNNPALFVRALDEPLEDDPESSEQEGGRKPGLSADEQSLNPSDWEKYLSNHVPPEVNVRTQETGRELYRRYHELGTSMQNALALNVFDTVIADRGLGDYGQEVGERYLTPLRDFFITAYPRFSPSQQPNQPQEDLSYLFEANVVVDAGASGEKIPVVYESEPTFRNLFGNAGDIVAYGGGSQMVQTTHMFMKAGSLLKANGGVLIIPFFEMLQNPALFPHTMATLDTALSNHETAPESLSDSSPTPAIIPSSKDPEPVPITTRVVLVMDRQMESEISDNPFFKSFLSRFGVRADVGPDTSRSNESEMQVAQLLGNLSRSAGLPHCDREAVALFVEYASRLAEDQKKISTAGFTRIKGILQEAAQKAEERDTDTTTVITADDVRYALLRREFRSNLIPERIREMIADGTLRIDTKDERVGAINGLTVSMIGGEAFGMPSRLTSTTRPGKWGIINVRRRQSGQILEAAVEETEGFFEHNFGREAPLVCQARITFEQSYSPMDGDSASLAQVCVVWSSLADVPIQQRFAITGSADMLRDSQPIGGANEKIEGFFAVCKATGSLGKDNPPGVVIPRSNVENLMLNEEVAKAAEDGTFAVYAVDTVAQAMEILTGQNEEELKEKATARLFEFNAKIQKWRGSTDEQNRDEPSDSPANLWQRIKAFIH